MCKTSVFVDMTVPDNTIISHPARFCTAFLFCFHYLLSFNLCYFGALLRFLLCVLGKLKKYFYRGRTGQTGQSNPNSQTEKN
jgi:hypothetical protein